MRLGRQLGEATEPRLTAPPVALRPARPAGCPAETRRARAVHRGDAMTSRRHARKPSTPAARAERTTGRARRTPRRHRPREARTTGAPPSPATSRASAAKRAPGAASLPRRRRLAPARPRRSSTSARSRCRRRGATRLDLRRPAHHLRPSASTRGHKRYHPTTPLATSRDGPNTRGWRSSARGSRNCARVDEHLALPGLAAKVLATVVPAARGHAHPAWATAGSTPAPTTPSASPPARTATSDPRREVLFSFRGKARPPRRPAPGPTPRAHPRCKCRNAGLRALPVRRRRRIAQRVDSADVRRLPPRASGEDFTARDFPHLGRHRARGPRPAASPATGAGPTTKRRVAAGRRPRGWAPRQHALGVCRKVLRPPGGDRRLPRRLARLAAAGERRRQAPRSQARCRPTRRPCCACWARLASRGVRGGRRARAAAPRRGVRAGEDGAAEGWRVLRPAVAELAVVVAAQQKGRSRRRGARRCGSCRR